MDTGKTVALIKALGGAGGGGGGGGDTVVLHIDENTGALDKTWQEITDLLAAGKRLVFYFPYDGSAGGTQVTILSTSVHPDIYAVWSFGYMVYSTQPDWYDFRAFADTANSYPLLD